MHIWFRSVTFHIPHFPPYIMVDITFKELPPFLWGIVSSILCSGSDYNWLFKSFFSVPFCCFILDKQTNANWIINLRTLLQISKLCLTLCKLFSNCYLLFFCHYNILCENLYRSNHCCIIPCFAAPPPDLLWY